MKRKSQYLGRGEGSLPWIPGKGCKDHVFQRASASSVYYSGFLSRESSGN